MKKVREYWIAQNTGWSGKISWFDNHDYHKQGSWHKTMGGAVKDAKQMAKRLPDSAHRVVHRIIQEEIFDILI